MNEYGFPLASTTHDIYLLRVWYEFDGPRPVWRASVLLPNDPRRRYFSEPDALLHFLGRHFQESSTDAIT
ncbi:hypothetical protein [Deinococcus yavapaiensis]|uniref:Uncharacterized protein n=1 Tax=Deinococcus yavapaiensis KR-236 TaxID=694435 RepID=A0A318SR90_9DEIO|nr:hypothetical protein [Deinococcus yavapaiensis]PYE55443.1 hypothetical protein DES52_103276 [Deinococcus yavapaiensis KR-236]